MLLGMGPTAAGSLRKHSQVVVQAGQRELGKKESVI